MKGLDDVKAATWDLHTRAERSGIIADILAGKATRFGVALLLRNLLPVYQILDASVVGHPILARSAAIEADLQVLAPDHALPLLAEGAAYAERVGEAAKGAAAGMPGHAYVRYLGDLNGGRIMKARLAACLGETAHALTLHDYPAMEDLKAFAHAYREELDLRVRGTDFTAVVTEALAAFEMNICLSCAIKARAA
jgi:heme oxygenase